MAGLCQSLTIRSETRFPIYDDLYRNPCVSRQSWPARLNGYGNVKSKTRSHVVRSREPKKIRQDADVDELASYHCLLTAHGMQFITATKTLPTRPSGVRLSHTHLAQLIVYACVIRDG